MSLDLNSNSIVACIVEGKAETAVIELLLKNDLLLFKEDNLLSGELIKERKAEKFAEKYLGKRFDSKVIVLRILDSRSENFNLKKIYQSKCIVYNVITAPEIEILIIINEHQYERFKKTKNMKASSFCSQVLNIGYKKTKEYWESYFSDINDLVAAIKEYDRLSKKSNSKKWNININELLVS